MATWTSAAPRALAVTNVIETVPEARISKGNGNVRGVVKPSNCLSANGVPKGAGVDQITESIRFILPRNLGDWPES
jgi:hypothetical protein